MATLNLLQEAPQTSTAASPLNRADRRDRAPSIGTALTDLLADAREGRVTVTSPGDRWLVLRIEETLGGFHDIEQMGTGDKPLPLTYAGGIAGSASVRARRARALHRPR